MSEQQENQDKVVQRKDYPLAFGSINPKNVELYKLLNQKTLPVTYSDHFYQKILQYQDFSMLAYYNDILVGAITAREEMFEDELTLYIMTFGVIERYRRLGFGSKLLNQLLNLAQQRSDIKAIYLHMWVKNESGYQFYLNNGFVKHRELENYYQDIEPPHCYILKRSLNQ